MVNKAVFCDRDGVINVDYGYVGKVEDFMLLRGVKEGLAAFRKSGYRLILTTNQSGIARGMYTETDFMELTAHMQELLGPGAHFDAVYFCPHHPEATVPKYREDCDCRKPKPGMFLNAERDFNLDMSACLCIGDHASDLLAAKNAGVGRLILVGDHLKEEREKLSALTFAYYPDLRACARTLTGF